MPKVKAQTPSAPPKRYRARVGITQDATPTQAKQEFTDGQFIDAEIVRDAPWLLEQGLVVEETEGEK
jgi:hypothetical protein